ncbi:THAP domain-containing protein 9 [Plakobranchus ocellatus]|uniref:THAP domain-containing protein 9 n=1 Tax=Plakobranchus ocellatus TaxID=259542 RepID=A0AAV4ALI0_9GAST|nr:THAP domain-containing protein 9 [Plakobranchus ocellatus]
MVFSLNPRNKFASGLKAAMGPQNEEEMMGFLDNTSHYIATIRDAAGNLMFATSKKTAFIGFLACIKSVRQIFKPHIGEDKPLKYLLTYKLYQDHLKLFFGAFRAAGGFNNNPTTRQFVTIYKRLLMRHDVEVVTGNTVPQDHTKLLTSAPITSAASSTVKDCTRDILVDRRFEQLVETKDEEIDTEIHQCLKCQSTVNLQSATLPALLPTWWPEEQTVQNTDQPCKPSSLTPAIRAMA